MALAGVHGTPGVLKEYGWYQKGLLFCVLYLSDENYHCTLQMSYTIDTTPYSSSYAERCQVDIFFP